MGNPDLRLWFLILRPLGNLKAAVDPLPRGISHGSIAVHKRPGLPTHAEPCSRDPEAQCCSVTFYKELPHPEACLHGSWFSTCYISSSEPPYEGSIIVHTRHRRALRLNEVTRLSRVTESVVAQTGFSAEGQVLFMSGHLPKSTQV